MCFNYKVLLLILLSAFLQGIFSPSSYGTQVLTENVISSDASGVTTGNITGGKTILASISDLTGGSSSRPYVAQFFVPSKSGNYTFGLSSSSQDTVIVLYKASFDSNTPGANVLDLNDDSDGNGAGGVSMSGCSGSNGLCPKLPYYLEANVSYYVVVTSYNPGVTIIMPLNFYVFGEEVSIGKLPNTPSEQAALVKTSIISAIRGEISGQIHSESVFQKKFLNDVRQRHRTKSNELISHSKTSQENNKYHILEHDIVALNNLTFNRKYKKDSFAHSNCKKKSRTVSCSQKGHFSAPKNLLTKLPLLFANSNINIDVSQATALLKQQINAENSSFRVFLFSEINQNYKEGVDTSTSINNKLAFEHTSWNQSTLGYFVDSYVGKRKTKSGFLGANKFTGFSLGTYFLYSPRPDSSIEMLLSIGQIENQYFGTKNGLTISGDYSHEKLYASVSSSGVVKFRSPNLDSSANQFEIWPVFLLSYSEAKRKSSLFKAEYYSVSEQYRISEDNIYDAKLIFAPEFKYMFSDNSNSSYSSVFSFIPSLIYSSKSFGQEGQKLGYGLSSSLLDSRGWRSSFNVGFENLASRKDLSVQLKISNTY